MKIVVLVALACLGTSAVAQTYPDAPSVTAGLRPPSTTMTEITDNSSPGATPAIRAVGIKSKRESNNGRLPPVLDRRFFMMNSIMFGAIAADLITTRRGLANGCTESSPLLGAHPSVGRQVGISAAEGLGVIALAYVFKKWTRDEEPGVARNIWMILPLMDGAAHGFIAAAWNAGKNCR